MENKRKGLLILIASLLVLTIGLTYAYYSAMVQGTGNTNAEASATTATLGEVEFNGENTFDTTNIGRDIYPGFIGVQTFTIAPYKDGHGIYEIDLEANVPSAFGSDIKITLYKTSDATNNNIESEEGSLTITNNQYVKQDTLTITGTLTKVYEGVLTDTDEEILEQVEFLIENNEFTTPDTTPDDYYTYYVVYEYLDNGNQNNQQGLDFDAKITVRYVTEEQKGPQSLGGLLLSKAIDNKLSGATYNAESETAEYYKAAKNNHIVFNNRMPAKLTGYVSKQDNLVMPFDTIEECNMERENSIGYIDGTISECTYNENDNTYDITASGYWVDDIYETIEECENLYGDTCETYEYYDGWYIDNVYDGVMMLRYRGNDIYSIRDLSGADINGIHQTTTEFQEGYFVLLSAYITGGTGYGYDPYTITTGDRINWTIENPPSIYGKEVVYSVYGNPYLYDTFDTVEDLKNTLDNYYHNMFFKYTMNGFQVSKKELCYEFNSNIGCLDFTNNDRTTIENLFGASTCHEGENEYACINGREMCYLYDTKIVCTNYTHQCTIYKNDNTSYCLNIPPK